MFNVCSTHYGLLQSVTFILVTRNAQCTILSSTSCIQSSSLMIFAPFEHPLVWGRKSPRPPVPPNSQPTVTTSDSHSKKLVRRPSIHPFHGSLFWWNFYPSSIIFVHFVKVWQHASMVMWHYCFTFDTFSFFSSLLAYHHHDALLLLLYRYVPPHAVVSESWVVSRQSWVVSQCCNTLLVFYCILVFSI